MRITVPSYPNYAVNEAGEIIGPYKKVLHQYTDRAGYKYIKAYIKGKPHFLFVHRAVCEAFHGPCPKGMYSVLHGNKGNSVNTPDNVRWGTHQENIAERDMRRES